MFNKSFIVHWKLCIQQFLLGFCFYDHEHFQKGLALVKTKQLDSIYVRQMKDDQIFRLLIHIVTSTAGTS